MAAVRRPALRPPTREIDEQTDVGEVYMRTLLRAQLRSALLIVGFLALVLGGIPLLFQLLPDVANYRIGPFNVAWIVLGVLMFPALLLTAAWYVRTAEKVERDFVDILRRR